MSSRNRIFHHPPPNPPQTFITTATNKPTTTPIIDPFLPTAPDAIFPVTLAPGRGATVTPLPRGRVVDGKIVVNCAPEPVVVLVLVLPGTVMLVVLCDCGRDCGGGGDAWDGVEGEVGVEEEEPGA